MCILHVTNKNLGTSRLIKSTHATKIQTYKTSNGDRDILVEEKSKILPKTSMDAQTLHTMSQL